MREVRITTDPLLLLPPGSSKSSAQIAAAPTSCEIFDSLKEDKEKEDAVSSDDDMFRWTFICI